MTNFWQGNLIRLRAVQPDDWNFFCETDKDVESSRYTDEILFPDPIERVKKWVSELAISEPWKHEFRLMIENLDGECVGTMNSHTCNPRAGTFQYGISIKPEHRQKGYATEAIKLLLNYFFGELRYQKVNVFIYAFNASSLELHRKLGFREEGKLRQMIYTDGHYYDEFVLGMTANEFVEFEKQKAS
jgi:RimJ/RimL family protein N-acetyltransferase